LDILVLGWHSVRDISQALGLSERDVLGHLVHVERGLRREKGFQVEAARCASCDFSFAKRSRIRAPSRCPVCRGTRIHGPRFRVGPV